LIEELVQVAKLCNEFEEAWGHSTPLNLIYKDSLASDNNPEPPQLITASKEYWEQLIKKLASQPELLYSINPRNFEELVAHILQMQGLEVKLTPETRDGGKDILAFLETPSGRHLYCVECKRYAPDRPVEVRLVREW
jgi:HJR/Mrr/RecB family endonuclease